MMNFRVVPQRISAAFFLMTFLAFAGLSYGSQDTLKVSAYATPDGGVMSSGSAVQSLVGVWNMEKGRPVAVWFHGGMTSGNCEKGLVAGGDLAEMLSGFTVISASACKQNHWVTPIAVGWIDAALDSIAARRGSPVDRISAVGISDGALGVLAYSIWGRRQVESRLLMSSYGAAFGDAVEIARLPKLKTGRWRFVQGGSDRLYPADATVPWITQFCNTIGESAPGVGCDMRFDPAGEHDWSYWKSRRQDWILEVFKQK